MKRRSARDKTMIQINSLVIFILLLLFGILIKNQNVGRWGVRKNNNGKPSASLPPGD